MHRQIENEKNATWIIKEKNNNINEDKLKKHTFIVCEQQQKLLYNEGHLLERIEEKDIDNCNVKKSI